MYEKIRQYLNQTYLGWVILDSFSQGKLVSLMSRLNIDYPGVRVTSLPRQDLAYDLAEEAFDHKEIMDILIEVLDEVNREEMQNVSQMSEDEVRAWIPGSYTMDRDRKIGKVIWVLLSDSRPCINKVVPKFINEVEKAMEEQAHFAQHIEEKMHKIDRILSSRKGLKKIQESISIFEKEIAKERKISAGLRRENERLRRRNIEQQKLIQELHRSYSELTQKKGFWYKQMTKKDREIESLNQQIRELKNQLVVGPKMRLKSEIHRLERENDKLNYTLEKERQDSSLKIADLEKQLWQTKNDLERLQQLNLQMQQQLEKEKEKFEELQKEYQALFVKKEPLVPKEKGNRLGIFIDNQNVYYSTKRQYSKKLDYRRLLNVLVKDRHLVKAICYIVQHPEISQEGFIAMLKNSGYTVRTRELIQRADGSAKGNWDIGIATDVITTVEKNNLDIVALVTCDGDFVDLIKLLSAKGKKVEVIGFPMNMAMDLKKEADQYYFITEDLMMTE